MSNDSSAPAAPVAPASRLGWLALIVVLAGVGVRLHAASGEFWLDEIWSLQLAGQHSAAEIAFELRHDNNHLLNTLWLKAAGEPSHWIVYRLPALLLGWLTIGLMAWVGRDRVEAACGLLVGASSHLLIQYGSEARGYGPMIAFALLAVGALQRALRDGGWRWSVLFAAAASLALLWHLTFVHVYAGLLVATLLAWRAGRAWRPLLAMHALPLLTLGWQASQVLRGIQIGGGVERPLPTVLADGAAWTLGLPLAGPWPQVALAALALLALAGLAWLARRRDPAAAALATTLALSPTAVLAIVQPALVYPRYLLPCWVAAQLLLAWTAAALWRRGGLARGLAGLLLLGFVAGNALHSARLLDRGRGGTLAALEQLQASTLRGEVTLISNADFEAGQLLAYYSRYLEATPRLRFLRRDAWPRGGADAYLLLGVAHPAEPPPQAIRDLHGNRYRLLQAFGTSELSGHTAAIYKRR